MRLARPESPQHEWDPKAALSHPHSAHYLRAGGSSTCLAAVTPSQRVNLKSWPRLTSLLLPCGKDPGLRLGNLAVMIRVTEFNGTVERCVRTSDDVPLVLEYNGDFEFGGGFSLAVFAGALAQGFIEDSSRAVVFELDTPARGVPSRVTLVGNAAGEQERAGRRDS